MVLLLLVITIMQGIYKPIPETNNVSRVTSVALLLLLLLLLLSLSSFVGLGAGIAQSV